MELFWLFLAGTSLAEADKDYEVVKCNNADTNVPEMTIRVKEAYYNANFDDSENFSLQDGYYVKVLAAADLTLKNMESDDKYIFMSHVISTTGGEESGIADIIFDGGDTITFTCKYSRTVTTSGEYDVMAGGDGTVDASQVGYLKYSLETDEVTRDWTSLTITPLHGLSVVKANLVECKISFEDNTLYPAHSFSDAMCLDSRLQVNYDVTDDSIKTKWRTFRFKDDNTDSQQKQTIECIIHLDNFITNASPSSCECFDCAGCGKTKEECEAPSLPKTTVSPSVRTTDPTTDDGFDYTDNGPPNNPYVADFRIMNPMLAKSHVMIMSNYEQTLSYCSAVRTGNSALTTADCCKGDMGLLQTQTVVLDNNIFIGTEDNPLNLCEINVSNSMTPLVLDMCDGGSFPTDSDYTFAYNKYDFSAPINEASCIVAVNQVECSKTQSDISCATYSLTDSKFSVVRGAPVMNVKSGNIYNIAGLVQEANSGSLTFQQISQSTYNANKSKMIQKQFSKNDGKVDSVSHAGYDSTEMVDRSLNSFNCGGAASDDSEDEDGAVQAPWVLRMFFQSEDQIGTKEGKQCTGTIVDEFWMITSSECCEHAGSDGFIEILFTNDRFWWAGNGLYQGGGLYVGPDFAMAFRKRRDTSSQDIYEDVCLHQSMFNILERAKEHSLNAKKICIDEDAPDNQELCFTGTWVDNGTEKTFQRIPLIQYDREICLKNSAYGPSDLMENQVCAGSNIEKLDDKDTITGTGLTIDTTDGGPLICIDEDTNAPLLVGIAARNSLSINDGEPGIFTTLWRSFDELKKAVETWTAWSDCSVSCKRARFRTCSKERYDNDDCPEDPDCTADDKCAETWINGILYQTYDCSDERNFCFHEAFNDIEDGKGMCKVDDSTHIEEEPYRRRKRRLAGGSTANSNSWNYFARLEFKENAADTNTWRCGGILVDKRHILTAAHCCDGKASVTASFFDKNTLTPDLGELIFSNIPSSDFIIHENYDSGTKHPHDVCLIQLTITNDADKPEGDMKHLLNYVPCWNLNLVDSINPNKNHGKNCWVAGMGAKTFQGVGATQLESIGINLLTETGYCQDHSHWSVNHLDSKEFCAGLPDTDKTEILPNGNHATQGLRDACNGDSGGPLICNMEYDNNGETVELAVLVGLVSRGANHCGDEGYPGIYTDIAQYKDWMANKIYGN